MRSVFKWRVATNKYLYITDGNPVEGSYPYGRPFLFNKKESKAYYSNEESTLLPTGVDEGKIQQFVGNINNENIYRDMYNTMVDFAKHLTIDKDVQNLTLDVDYKPYFNLDNDTCVIEAVTPKCEGYEPVFDFRVHTVDDSGNTQVVNYDFYPERNEHDKTLRYVLDFEVPKGEKGDPGNDGAGCKGDKGDQGDTGPTPFFTATATASEATGDTADVTVEVTPDTSTKPRTYNLDFKFEIPAGTPGDPGNDGNDGKDDVFTGITASAERLGYDQVPYVRIYDDSSNRNVNRVKTIWNPEEIHDPDRGVDIDGRYESSFYMELGIPEGAPGIQGPEGRPSNIRIVDATVEETLEPGEQAQARAEVVRLESNNEFDIHLFFKIPRGQDGENGRDGEDGDNSIRYNFSSEVIPSDEVDTIVLDWDQRFLPTEDAPTIIEETLQLYYPSVWGRGVEINLNGEDIEEKATFYAPLDGGDTAGKVLMNHGENNAPTWASVEGGKNIEVDSDPTDDGTITIDAKLPKTEHELMYYDENKSDNGYDGLFTQQLRMNDGLVVDNATDLATCMNGSQFSMEEVARTWTRHNFNASDPLLGNNPSTYDALGTSESPSQSGLSAINAWHYVDKNGVDKRLYNGVTTSTTNPYKLSDNSVQDYIYNYNNPSVYTFLRSAKKYSSYYSKMAIGVEPGHNLSGYTDRLITIPAQVIKNGYLYQIEVYTNNYNDSEPWIGSGDKTVGIAIRKTQVPFNKTVSSGTDAVMILTREEGLDIVPFDPTLNNYNTGSESAMVLETMLFNNILTITFSLPYRNNANYTGGTPHDDEVALLTNKRVTIDLENYTLTCSTLSATKDFGENGNYSNQTVRDVFDALRDDSVYRGLMQESTPGCMWRNIRNLDGGLIFDFTEGAETVYQFNGSTTTPWTNLHLDPHVYFTGSRISFNDITNKLFYSDGVSIQQIANISDNGTIVTLNGVEVENPSFYAPTTAGTNGQYLKSNGSGAPTWETFPTIPAAANDGKLTIKANTTTVREFTANQSTNSILTFLGSGGTSVTGDANGNVTISTDSHYTVKSISTIITAPYSNVAQQYNVECDYIPGSLTKVVDISTFATNKYTTPSKYVWTKASGTTGKYVGLFGTQQTSGRSSCIVTISDTVTGEVESHYYAIVYDTPSDTTFTFITTNSWGITLKWTTTSGSEKILAYLNVPDTFVGTITVEPIGYNNAQGNSAYSFEGNSSAITTSGWANGDGTTKVMTLFDGSSLYGSNIEPSDFRTPYGNYPVAIISDFNGSLAVGSKIQDALINAYMLQDMSKKVNTMYRMLFPTT